MVGRDAALLNPDKLTDTARLDDVLRMTAADSILLGADLGGSLVMAGEGEMSVREMVDRAENRARGMIVAGLEPGERVLLSLPSSIDLVVWAWATMLAGGSVVMISTRSTDFEIKAFAATADAKWVISDKSGGDTIGSEQAATRFRASGSVELPPTDPSGEVACFATSGSTGSSKLACFANRTFPAQAISYQHMIGGDSSDVIIFPQPMVHVAFIPQVHFTLVQGRRLVVLPTFDARAVVDAAYAESATVINGTPTMWSLILDRTSFRDHRLPLRLCNYAAAPMPAPLATRLIEAARCDVVHAYGLTEAGGVMTSLPADRIISKAGSAGSLLPPQESMAILDPGSGAHLDNGDEGEICLRGPAACLGYVGDPRQTNELWRGGWLHTGDLGRIDSDGDLWVTGRIKEQISRGGLKIGAREVEAVIEEILGVTGVGVAGVADPVLGERVGAVVETSESSIDAATIRGACAAKLADYKVPDRIVLVRELPRNSMAKTDKPAVRRILDQSS